MNYIDIIILIPLIWSAVKGFKKGFITEFASLAALILGIYTAVNFSYITTNFLKNNLNINFNYLDIVSFIITFIIIVIIVHYIAKLVTKLIKLITLGFVNRIFGAVFAILKVAFFLSIIIFIIERIEVKTHIIPQKIKNESLLYNPVQDISLIVFPGLKKINVQEIKESIIKSKTV